MGGGGRGGGGEVSWTGPGDGLPGVMVREADLEIGPKSIRYGMFIFSIKQALFQSQ